ncbi:hypothetical protein HGB13_00005 [bacterium]|nr:hypothetical protein [bacterium]
MEEIKRIFTVVIMGGEEFIGLSKKEFEIIDSEKTYIVRCKKIAPNREED